METRNNIFFGITRTNSEFLLSNPWPGALYSHRSSLYRQCAMRRSHHGGDEAGPSMTAPEESVGDYPRSVRIGLNHSIFLSHSGAQKSSVRRLYNALERNGYYTFFDENADSLPGGEPFAPLIKSAAQLANVAIVVLSEEFFQSKWPMIELAIFVEEQCERKKYPGCRELKIVPLFMGLSVEEFGKPERERKWCEKWSEYAAVDSRIEVAKWIQAVEVLGRTNGIERWKFRNEEEYIERVVSIICKLVPPDKKWDDSHVKGKSNFKQAVTDMFARAPSKTRYHDVRAIGLYGVGGMGKTTICKSLCNDFHAEFYGKVLHVELGKKNAEEIPRDVFYDLGGTGKASLNQMGWKYKVFLAIDNVWDEVVSMKPAEALLKMGFHPDSLVIVTSRSPRILEWLGIHEECCFGMPTLDKADATTLLLEAAAPGCDIGGLKKNQRVAVDKIVERCFMTKGPISGADSEKQYVPLALEVLGRQLRIPLHDTEEELTRWVNELVLTSSDQKEHPIFSVLRLSYDNLPNKHKGIFLDVAVYAPRQEDNTSYSVHKMCKWLSMVHGDPYRMVMKVLERLRGDGLLEGWESPESSLGIHELYCEFAKAEGIRDDNPNRQLHLYHEGGGNEDGCGVAALMESIPCASYWPLKRIFIYGGGFSGLSNRELQYMVNVEVLDLQFCCELKSVDLQCLKSLRSLELRGCFQLHTIKGLRDLQRLKFFWWNTCRVAIVDVIYSRTLEIVEIYGSKQSVVSWLGSLEECVALIELTLRHHPWVALPYLYNLTKLEKLDLSDCCGLEEMHDLVGLLCLRHLNLQNCESLVHGNGVEGLVELETLNLEGCKSMAVPDLSRLIKLRSMNIGGNLVVRDLVVGSSRLEELGIIGCDNLRTVVFPSYSGVWKLLNQVNEEIRIRGHVEPRHRTFACSSILIRNAFDVYETVNFSYCHTVQEYLGDIGSLRSLRHLYLQNCKFLRTLPDFLCGSPCLEVVDLSCCSELEDLGDFTFVGSLRCLNVSGCVSLRTLPNLSHAPLLETLNVKDCIVLSALSQMSTPDVVIDVTGCTSLVKIPVLEGVGRVELEAHVGNYGEVDENMVPSLKFDTLKIRCGSRGASGTTNENNLESTITDSEASDQGLPTILPRSDVRHFHNWDELFGLEEWERRGFSTSSTDFGTKPSYHLGSVTISIWKNVIEIPMSRILEKVLTLNLKDRRELRGLSNVRSFYEGHLNDSTPIRMRVYHFTSLQALHLIGCDLLDGLQHWGPLPALESLEVRSCITLSELPDLRSSTKLLELDVYSCPNLCDAGQWPFAFNSTYCVGRL